MRRGEFEQSTFRYKAWQRQAVYVKAHSSVSSPPQCQYQEVVCVSTPRIYLQSGYFPVLSYYLIDGKTNAKFPVTHL